MKTILLLTAAVFSLGCSKSPSVDEVKKTAQDMRSGNTEPVRYVNSLQNDLKKAEAATVKMNKSEGQTQQAVDNAVKGADEAGQAPQ